MKKIALFLACLAVVALTFGCKKAAGGNTKLEQIKAAGKIVVYTNPEFPPYEYLGAKGAITGAEIDLVNRIAERLGVKAEIVSSEFDAILMTVQSGKADMGASGFTITEERSQKVDFSTPFDVSVQYLIIPETSAVKCLEDLAGKKIGGQNGTTGFLMIEDEIKKGLLKDKNVEAKSFNNAPDAVVAMKNGRIDAVVIDKQVAKALAAKNPGYKAIELINAKGENIGEREEFGIMIAKGNNDTLMALINEVIWDMKRDGSLDAAFAKHNAATEQ